VTEPLAGSAHLMRKTLASALPGVLLGLLIGLNETRYPGYVVPFDIIGVLLYSGIAAFVTLLLLLFKRSRSGGRFGLLLVVALEPVS